ncbi:MAG TPA: DUF3280 domain-containing protein [Hyphomicrobium sp.]|jgi:hypothetical protein|uniref:DUF3280 domain-containing protein n=1 Tax=Hyphomicrobium sp. TaxID=82 RepID=UPI002C197BEE|nr:DUF3280 domain-containing protein [Hyphomicrobium sp.]HXE01153.1 DUF3280 domain-containing protein [Hyphomicrobium sp.]
MLQRFLCALFAVLIVTPAAAATKAAVFPFDIRDVSQEGELIPQLNTEDVRRLKLVADELKTLMQKDGKYEVVDLTSQAKEIEAAAPFDKCDGCEVPIAKEAGADVAVTGYVDKWSDALLSISLVTRDTQTGKLTKTMQAQINGNNDDLWLHGVRYLWKNRFNAEAPAK